MQESGGGRQEEPKLVYILFEPTCAYCTVGSYASLSVRPSVRLSVFHWVIFYISESIIAMNLKVFTGTCNAIDVILASVIFMKIQEVS